MTIAAKSLADDGARRVAISAHSRSMLVEAGAGSGKTAVMAGRIAAMLAETMHRIHREESVSSLLMD